MWKEWNLTASPSAMRSIPPCIWTGCVFRNVFFEDCEFDAIDMIDTVFENCELSNLHFNKGAIHRCVFRNCRCMGIDSAIVSYTIPFSQI